MYQIIGGDGKEYGPVSTEQVMQWIREGRADGNTRIRAAESTTWTTVGALPEFAPALTGAAPPALGEVNPEQLAAEILARGYEVRIGSCISRGWELVKKNFWLCVGACFVNAVIQGGLGAIPFLGPVVGLVLGGVFQGGVWYFFLKLIRNQNAEFGDIFAGFSLAFVPLMLASIVSQILTALGFLFCILPGIYLAIAWMFTIALVIDKKLDFWPAMELSRKVLTRNWWSFLGLILLGALILLGGALACLVGIFVAIPVIVASLAYAYEDIFGAQAKAALPATNPVAPAQPQS